MQNTLKFPLRGIIPPLVTPFLDNNTLDIEGLGRLIEHTISGGVHGGANMFPKLYVELYHAAVNRDFETIIALQQKVMQISATIYEVGHYGSSYLKGLKCALSVMGICNNFMAEPFHKFKEPERLKIRQLLDEFNYSEWL